MKIKKNLYLESSLVEQAEKILSTPPKKSLSAYVDECLYSLIQQSQNKYNKVINSDKTADSQS